MSPGKGHEDDETKVHLLRGKAERVPGFSMEKSRLGEDTNT